MLISWGLVAQAGKPPEIGPWVVGCRGEGESLREGFELSSLLQSPARVTSPLPQGFIPCLPCSLPVTLSEGSGYRRGGTGWTTHASALQSPCYQGPAHIHWFQCYDWSEPFSQGKQVRHLSQSCLLPGRVGLLLMML